MSNLQRGLAELLGTFWLAFGGCGSAVLAAAFPEVGIGLAGVSLAFVCAAKRIPVQIVTSEASSKDKRDHMAALGARLTLVPSPTGETTKALILEMIEEVTSMGV